MDDIADFAETKASMAGLGLRDETINSIFSALRGILYVNSRCRGYAAVVEGAIPLWSLLLSYSSITTGALGSPSLHSPFSMIVFALHITIILIITLTSFNP